MSSPGLQFSASSASLLEKKVFNFNSFFPSAHPPCKSFVSLEPTVRMRIDVENQGKRLLRGWLPALLGQEA